MRIKESIVEIGKAEAQSKKNAVRGGEARDSGMVDAPEPMELGR